MAGCEGGNAKVLLRVLGGTRASTTIQVEEIRASATMDLSPAKPGCWRNLQRTRERWAPPPPCCVCCLSPGQLSLIQVFSGGVKETRFSSQVC